MPTTSTGQVLEWIAKEKGRTVAAARSEYLDIINDVRRLFYALNQKIRLDFHIEGCFPVHEFYEPCVSCECTPATYFGVTLPQEMEQVESAWLGTAPMTIYNRWVEYKDGIKGNGGSLKLIDVGNDFPLQMEWDPRKCVKPVFVATDPKDHGKKVTISFTNSNGEDRKEELILCPSGAATSSEAMQIKRPAGIILPMDLVGGIEVYDCFGGKHLGFLSSKNHVPAFRRVKVTNVCCDSVIHIRGTRRYTEVQFDWEPVETDNKLAILEAMRYLAIMSVNSSDAQWLAKARNHMTNVIEYLGGDNLRDEGPATVRQFDFMKQAIRRSGLLSRRFARRTRTIP